MEEATQNGTPCRILLTQPRRIAATSVAKRISAERGEQHGNSVGHQIRLEKCRKTTTNLIVTTSGYLLQCIVVGVKKAFENITHIILDEIHEREINTDLLLISIKRVLKENRTLKVILMSATLNADQFCEYFHGCPKIEVPGRLFDVKCLQLEEVLYQTGYKTDAMEKYLESSMHCDNDQNQLLMAYNSSLGDEIIDFDLLVHVIEFIHNSTSTSGSILIFLPGYHDIMQCHDMLESKLDGKENYKIFILHSNVEEDNVFNPLENRMRKIIISTNIAETSVTINDVVRIVFFFMNFKMIEKHIQCIDFLHLH